MDLNQNLKNDQNKDCYQAIKDNDLKKLARFVEKYGVDANVEAGTCLHAAIFQNNVGAAAFLLEASANPNSVYNHSTTPLLAAIDERNWNMAKLLIEKGADVHLKDPKNNSPLSKALFHFEGDTSVIELLLSRGADPYQNLLDGYTPMDLAKSMKLTAMMQTLMQKYQVKD